MARHELILGGVRSGKSRCAQSRAADWLAVPGHEALLIATARPGDAEMRERIALHRADRARNLPALRTIELDGDLAAAITARSAPHRLLVVDCLTLWLTQRLMPPAGTASTSTDPIAHDGLTAALREAAGPVVLVSNEIGLGVMPLGRENRRFLDALGALHQQVAAPCARVTLMVAGIELAVKA